MVSSSSTPSASSVVVRSGLAGVLRSSRRVDGRVRIRLDRRRVGVAVSAAAMEVATTIAAALGTLGRSIKRLVKNSKKPPVYRRIL